MFGDFLNNVSYLILLINYNFVKNGRHTKSFENMLCHYLKNTCPKILGNIYILQSTYYYCD